MLIEVCLEVDPDHRTKVKKALRETGGNRAPIIFLDGIGRNEDSIQEISLLKWLNNPGNLNVYCR